MVNQMIMLCSGVVLVYSILVQVTLSAVGLPDCNVRDGPCDGIAVSGNVTTQIEALYDHLCGCVYVTGAINIQVMPELDTDDDLVLVESDFSFLYHIREIYDYLYLENIPEIDRISLPNLRIIRGENLNDQNALTVFNSSIGSLYMPNLTEITKGNIRFGEDKDQSTPYHCNILTVNWADILPLDGTLTLDLNTDSCTDQFKPNCSSLGCDYCWCDDMSAGQCCQELTRMCIGCNEGARCRRKTINGENFINCCNSACAGGCDGGEDTHCRACKLPTVDVLNGDTCEAECPARFSSSGVENPDYLLKYKNLCVKPCPEGTFELNNAVCVEVCPTGMRSVPSETGGMKCETCDEYCKECKGGYIEYLENGCTLITGSLYVNDYSIGWWWTLRSKNKVHFPKLKSIRMVRGTLMIWNLFKVEQFPYLSNLEVVGNDFLEADSCSPYDDRLVIHNNHDLVSIDFSSLRSVIGHVRMYNNPKLCLVGNFGKFVSNGLLQRTSCLNLSPSYRRPVDQCVADNIVCHSECDPIDGCWGTTDTDCVTCINYQYNGRCVQTCEDYSNLGEYMYSNSTNSCNPCHELCNGSCDGKGPTHCHSCKTGVFGTINSGAGFKCLNQCNTDNTYSESRHNNPAGTVECLPCSSSCIGGCSGPLNIIDHSNGCFECDTVILNSTGNQVMCTGECPIHYYIDNEVNSSLSNYAREICVPCHDNCYTCHGPELTDCIAYRQCNDDVSSTSTIAWDRRPSSKQTVITTSMVTFHTISVSTSNTDTPLSSIISTNASTSTRDPPIARSSTSTGGSSPDWLYFLLVVPTALVIVLMLVVAAWFYYRKQKRNSTLLGVGPTMPLAAVNGRSSID